MDYWAHNDLLDVLFRYAPTFHSSAEEICAAIGLDFEKATAIGGVVPSASLVDAVEWAAERSGYPCFGLLTAQRTDHRMIGLAGLIGERGLSLAQHFDLIAHHLPLHNTGYAFKFDANPEGPSSRMIMHCQGAFQARHYVEGVMAVQARMLRRMMGPDWSLAGVEFAHGSLGPNATYQAAFAAPISFEAGRNALLFSPEDLRWSSHGPEFQSDLVVDAGLRDLALTEANDLVARVGRLVKARLPEPTTLAGAAAELAMSARSLQRRLAAEGESFTDIVTRARVALAQDYLRHPGVSMMQVASRLGFRHVSVMSRMLKRELGVSPKTLRK